MKYTYLDGAGNKFVLLNNQLTYTPMKPELSSSGVYDGGNPFTIDLKKIDVIRLIDVFERAFWSEKDHSEMRRMGCGTLFKSIGEESTRIYLSYKSESLEEINNLIELIKSDYVD